MKLTKATIENIEKIMSMIEDVKAKMQKEKLTIWDEEYPTITIIEEDIKNGTGQLVYDQEDIIGYVSLGEDIEGRLHFPQEKILFISRLVIEASSQGQGIGSKLFQLIEKEARKKQYYALGLLGNHSNKRAISLFRKSGFHDLGAEIFPWGEENLFIKVLNPKKEGKKFISWNVNGLRAIMKKGFEDFLKEHNPDILALQEIKMNKEQADFEFKDYYVYWNSAERKGYSGTCILTKDKPLKVFSNFPFGQHPDEGRILTLEYEDYYFVTVYAPNSKRDLLRLDYRMQFEDDLRSYLSDLKKEKPVILCGDFNVSHQEIDLRNPKMNMGNAGFSDQEREKMTQLLESGFIDTFRFLYPTRIAYTWWSYLFNARKRNIGWRLDYFLISSTLKRHLIDSFILSEVMGSDHCPVGIVLHE